MKKSKPTIYVVLGHTGEDTVGKHLAKLSEAELVKFGGKRATKEIMVNLLKAGKDLVVTDIRNTDESEVVEEIVSSGLANLMLIWIDRDVAKEQAEQSKIYEELTDYTADRLTISGIEDIFDSKFNTQEK